MYYAWKKKSEKKRNNKFFNIKKENIEFGAINFPGRKMALNEGMFELTRV